VKLARIGKFQKLFLSSPPPPTTQLYKHSSDGCCFERENAGHSCGSQDAVEIGFCKLVCNLICFVTLQAQCHHPIVQM
jgi:hypothetical protein